MDDSTLWKFILFVTFSLGIVALTSVVRLSIEYVLYSMKMVIKNNKFWNNLLLPILPVTLGFILSFSIKEYPYPTELSTVGARCIYGLVAGLMSSFLYRFVKAVINQKISNSLTTTTLVSENTDEDSLVK